MIRLRESRNGLAWSAKKVYQTALDVFGDKATIMANPVLRINARLSHRVRASKPREKSTPALIAKATELHNRGLISISSKLPVRIRLNSATATPCQWSADRRRSVNANASGEGTIDFRWVLAPPVMGISWVRS